MEEGKKGICRLSIVPVRGAPDHKSEMVTQLLFGEHYTVLEADTSKKWIRISSYHDGYTGWISSDQYVPVSEEYFDQINKSNYKICLDLSTTILYGKSQVNILMGSIIPIATSELFRMEEKLAFNGESKSLGQKRDFEFIKLMGQKLMNTPYLWGGRTPYGIDCSGFVQLLFRLAGYSLKRDSSDQFQQGSLVESFQDIRPGDLAFFKNAKDKIDHVGICLESGKIMHASGKVKTDDLTGEGIEVSPGVFTHTKPSFRRILLE